MLLAPAGGRTEESLADGRHGCNNEAELHAICRALELAAGAGARHLLLHSDSDVALRCVRDPGATRIGRLLQLSARARELLRPFATATLVWLPRHRNADADRLARLALGLPAALAPAARRGGRRR